MKDIKTYIGEAVARRKSGKYNEFPRVLDIDEIVKFLESKGTHFHKGPMRPNHIEERWVAIFGEGIQFFIGEDQRYDNNYRYKTNQASAWVYADDFDEIRKMIVKEFGWE